MSVTLNSIDSRLEATNSTLDSKLDATNSTLESKLNATNNTLERIERDVRYLILEYSGKGNGSPPSSSSGSSPPNEGNEGENDETGQHQDDQAAQMAQQRARIVAELLKERNRKLAEEIAETAEGEDMAEIINRAAEAVNQQEEQAEDVEVSFQDLEAVEGLDSTYADRLRERGIGSITHLAQASAETVADAAEVSENRAEKWIATAQTKLQQ